MGYLKGSKERAELEKALKATASKEEDVPIIIGDEEIRTKDVRYQVNQLFTYKFFNAVANMGLSFVV